MSKVTIAPVSKDSTNIIGVYESNPELGWIRVEQHSSQINDKGWLTKVKRSSFIKGNVTDLAEMNYKLGQELHGKIVVKESFTAFNEKDPENDLKIAGDTGIVCRVDDQPIYRQSFFTTNENAQDELIMHTNTAEIRSVLEATRAINRLQPADL